MRIYLEPMITLSDDAWKDAISIYRLKHFKKGESIRVAGEVCTEGYYLSEGAVRTYVIGEEGKEQTLMVHVNRENNFFDPFFGDFISYVTQTEGEIFAEAIEDCKVYISDMKEVESLYESDIKWMKLGKLLAEEQLVKLVERKKWLRLDAKERYLYIQKHRAVFETILPDYHLASLLSIAPQSLSRIRKELNG
ncbi:MAG: Crp/Fnr family transcriptional regulator [Sulfurovum sp.]|nr:Crp/Fnr family transcriptional regulator [Sulfurovum sp.]